jgi:hypothetical protein
MYGALTGISAALAILNGVAIISVAALTASAAITSFEPFMMLAP